MIRTIKLCLLSLMAIALCASVSQASVSDVSVLGNGNLTIAGSAVIYGDKSVAGTWIDLVADDTVIDSDPVTVNGSKTKDFKTGNWLFSSPSKITASLTIEELLTTANPGDTASDSIMATLQVLNHNGTVVSSSSAGFPIANSVADGGVLGPVSTTLELSVWTPNAAGADYTNYGTFRLIVEGVASAFTSPQSTQPPNGDGDDEPGDDEPGDNNPPVVPAPGAMVLASLGMGLVSWLRTRRSL